MIKELLLKKLNIEPYRIYDEELLLKKLNIEPYRIYDEEFICIETSRIIYIDLDKPLNANSLLDILKSFDNHHWIYSEHWWSNTTENDYPSKHPEIYRNGIILRGTDFNDGLFNAFLFVSNDCKIITYRYYSGELISILRKYNMNFKIKQN